MLAVREATTVIPFRRNSYVVKELTAWHAATGHPIYRPVFSQRGTLPAVATLCLADLPSTSDSRAALRNQHLGVASDPADDYQLPTCLLNTSWMLTASHTLHADVPAQLRTEEELITFWSAMQTTDDYAVATGPISRRDAR